METAALTCGNATWTLRRASAPDVPAIVALLATDALAATRGESADPADRVAYEDAFARIDGDAAQLLVVVEGKGGVVGTMQLTLIPGLARRGVTRLQIEAVRVHADHQGQGVGSAMIRWALAEGARRGATLAQLTSDRTRTSAHGFYERLGFSASHLGFKYPLPPSTGRNNDPELPSPSR